MLGAVDEAYEPPFATVTRLIPPVALKATPPFAGLEFERDAPLPDVSSTFLVTVPFRR